MTYAQALEYLDGFLNYEKVTAYRYPEVFSLDRMREFLRALGNPQEQYPILHVAGTKGKGSTCAFAASILRAAGYRVGLYTSPHLISFRERIQVDGRPISEEALADVVTHLRPFADGELTYFEITTGCAFFYFATQKVDVAVVEVGMGGRLDSTNVVEPEVTAITPVSLDHMEKLGNTVEVIAREKAGIIKPHVPVVLGPQRPEAQIVIEKVAASLGAPVHAVDDEVQVDSVRMETTGSRSTFQTPTRVYSNIHIPLVGRHQVTNGLTAVRMVELWTQRRGGIDPLAVNRGLAQTKWPGRCQIVEGTPTILLDGAHNAASAQALRDTAKEIFPNKRAVLVLGTSLEKDLEGMARVLGPWCQKLIVTQAQVPRAESPQRLAAVFRSWHPLPRITASVREALDHAWGTAAPEDLIVVTGSLFVVGEALQLTSGAGGVCVPEKVSRR